MQLKWPMLWDLFSLFPAHAGVIPRHNEDGPQMGTFPRTRGGDPFFCTPPKRGIYFSPHTRG